MQFHRQNRTHQSDGELELAVSLSPIESSGRVYNTLASIVRGKGALSRSRGPCLAVYNV